MFPARVLSHACSLQTCGQNPARTLRTKSRVSRYGGRPSWRPTTVGSALQAAKPWRCDAAKGQRIPVTVWFNRPEKAEFVGQLLNTMGYRTRVSPEGPDSGIDIVAHKDDLGFEPPIIKVQVKSTEGSVGDPLVSAVYGKVGAGEFGLMVTLGTFTVLATSFAKSKSNLRLIDGDELVKLMFQHYDEFDSRYKGLLPLRRVYVPEVIDTEDE